jgi:hypothetical protein
VLILAKKARELMTCETVVAYTLKEVWESFDLTTTRYRFAFCPSSHPTHVTETKCAEASRTACSSEEVTEMARPDS